MKDSNKKAATETVAVGLIAFGAQRFTVAIAHLPQLNEPAALTGLIAVTFGFALRLMYESIESKQHKSLIDEIIEDQNLSQLKEAISVSGEETAESLDELGGISEEEN